MFCFLFHRHIAVTTMTFNVLFFFFFFFFFFLFHRHIAVTTMTFKGMDSEPHKTPYVYVKYHHKFIPGKRESISGLLRKIFVFKVGKPSFFPASE